MLQLEVVSLRTPLFGPTSWWLGRDQIFFWPGVAYRTCDLGRISPTKKHQKPAKSQKENRWRNSCQVVLRNQVATSTGKDFVGRTFQQKLQGDWSIWAHNTPWFWKGTVASSSASAWRLGFGSHDSCVWPWNFFSIKNSKVGQVVVLNKVSELFSARKLGVSWSKLTDYNISCRSVGQNHQLGEMLWGLRKKNWPFLNPGSPSSQSTLIPWSENSESDVSKKVAFFFYKSCREVTWCWK